MIYIALALILLNLIQQILVIPNVNAQYHPPEEIAGGNFSNANFEFPKNLFVNQSLTIINGDLDLNNNLLINVDWSSTITTNLDADTIDNQNYNSNWPTTQSNIQSALSNDFHNIGGTDDDVPESGDFGAAADLDASGQVADDSHNHIYSNFDATTSANWRTRVSDETGVGYMVFSSGPTLTTPDIGDATADSLNTTELIVGDYNLTPITTKIIYFDNSMSASEIQAIIDSQPKYIPYETNLTFQFEDGTYTLDNMLVFGGFYGGGKLFVYGNRSETNANTLHTTQSVFLDFSSYDTHGLLLHFNNVYLEVYNLKIKTKTSAIDYNPLTIATNSIQSRINFNYVLGTSTSFGRGIVVNGCQMEISSNYVSNLNRGIFGFDAAHLSTTGNHDTGTMPAYGIMAHGGSYIGLFGTSIDGSVADTYATNGGSIVIS